MASETATLSLSRPVKEAIKTALAITLAVGIALAMGWEKPHWAAFGVAFTSLGTEGQSINRGAERMFGTLVAVVAAFVFLSWFPQQRWALMAVVSTYVGICAYLMQGEKRSYFWYASGFICTVIIADSHDSLSSFQLAVERAQETGLGIFVNAMVTTLLWPITTRSSLIESSRRLISIQGQLFAGYRNIRLGESDAKDFRKLRGQMLQRLNQVSQSLESAVTDDVSVWGMRNQWREFVSLSRGVAEEMGHWRTSLADLTEIELGEIFPNLDQFESEIARRFKVIATMSEESAPEPAPRPTALEFDESAASSLSPIQRAAVDNAFNHLRRIEEGTRALFECVSELVGKAPIRNRTGGSARPGLVPSRYPDRLMGVGIVLGCFWISFLITLYVRDWPGGASFWQMSTLYAVLTVRTGAPPFSGVAAPIVIASILGALMYVFILPHLSGFGELGTLLFVWSFGVAYYYSGQAGAKASMLANSISTLSIANEQTYSFAGTLNSLYMSVLLGALLVGVYYFASSPRPEKVFLRHYRRFFRHARELLQLQAVQGGKPHLFARLRSKYLERDLLSLPDSLSASAKKIDARTFPGAKPSDLEDLTANLYDLAFRVRDLVEARAALTDEEIGAELDAKLKEWEAAWDPRLLQWDEGHSKRSTEELRSQLQRELSELEGLVANELDASTDEVASEKTRRLFGLLASNRGLADAEIGIAEVAQRINWTQLQETRF